MNIDIIPQFELGTVLRKRVGDYINNGLSSEECSSFKFAVAYMRLSGVNRIAPAIESLLNRGGVVSGAIGIDDKVTSVEALETLSRFSQNSTIFYTTSDFIYHPKYYLFEGNSYGTAIVGSANLTRDGLYRNIEIATVINFNFNNYEERDIFEKYDGVINELLDTENPNVRPNNSETVNALKSAGLIGSEAQSVEMTHKRINRNSEFSPENQNLLDIQTLFPTIKVPTAPPTLTPYVQRTSRGNQIQQRTIGNIDTFIMQLSVFDSSHRTGIPGTPEVLIPLEAREFFPPLIQSHNRVHPDANFDVALNTETGQEIHYYRVWYYASRSEFRLRMDHDTIDVANIEGGDLLIINKLVEGSDPLYEVTILSPKDIQFPLFASKLDRSSNGKRWGMGRF